MASGNKLLMAKSKQCAHKRPGGQRCKKRRKPGSKYCPLHAKVYDKRMTHGKKTDFAKALGIAGSEAQSYEEFLQDQKPHKLHREMAQARALLVEYRKAYRRALEDAFKVDFLEDCHDYIESYLVESEGLVADKAGRIAKKVLTPISDAFDEHLSHMGIDGEYIKTITNLIKLIAQLGEKMKKIEEGTTFNVVIKQEYLLDFVRDDVFSVMTDLDDRKRLAMNLQARLGRNGLPKALLPMASEEDIVDAEFEEIGATNV